MAVEGLVLAHPTKSSITLNGSTWGLEALDLGNPPRRDELVSSIDASGAIPFRVAPRENREVTARVRLIDASTMDAAMDAIGDLEDILEDAERLAASDPDDPVLDLVRLVYTPAGSNYSYSLIVYAAEIQDVPRTLSGEDAGFFIKRPVVTIRALCDPYAYGAGETSPTKTTWLDETIAGAALATSVKIPESGSIGGDVSPWVRLSIEDEASLVRNRVVMGVRQGEGITSAAFDPDGMTLVNGTKAPNFLLKFGSTGSGNGQFNPSISPSSGGPFGIATDSSGNIYVADKGNSRVQKFDLSGTFLLKFGSLGAGDGQFYAPEGIAVDGSGNIYVADTSGQRVQKFSSAGTFLLKFGSSGTGDGQFATPRHITVDGSGNVYVVDAGINARIQKFDSSGNFLMKFGSLGTGNGQFTNPFGIALDSSGNIYVSDQTRIQKFDSSGTFVSKFGSSGTGDGQFGTTVAGLDLDATGNIYVADPNNHRIQKFDSSGTFVSKFGSSGTGDGQFSNPFDVAISPNERIVVMDTYNRRVQIFSGSSAITATSNDWSIAARLPSQTRTGTFRAYLANATSESDGYARLVIAPSGGASRTSRSVYLTNGTVRDADLGEISVDTPWEAWIETVDSAKFTGIILVPTDSFIEIETTYGSGGAQPIGQVSISDKLNSTSANIDGRTLTAGTDSGSWSTGASGWFVVNYSADDYGARRAMTSMSSPAIALAGTGDYINVDLRFTVRAGIPAVADTPAQSTPFIGAVARFKDSSNYLVVGLAYTGGYSYASPGVWKVKAGSFSRIWTGQTRSLYGTSFTSGGNVLLYSPVSSFTFQVSADGQFYVGIRYLWITSYSTRERGATPVVVRTTADESTSGYDRDLADGAALGNSTAAQTGLFDYQTLSSPAVTREWRDFQVSGNDGGDGPSGLVAVTPPAIPALGKLTLSGSKLLTKFGGEYPYLGSSGIRLEPEADNNLTLFVRQSSSEPGVGSALSENLNVKVDGWPRFLSVPHSAGSIGIS